MPIAVELGNVIPITDIPRRVNQERVRLTLPLEDMGKYQRQFHLKRMADIIIGNPADPLDVLTLISSKADQVLLSEPKVQLIAVDQGTLRALRENKPLEDIEYDRDGHYDLSDPSKAPIKIGAEADFGRAWIKRTKKANVIAAASIICNGSVEISDLSVSGLWVRAHWGGAERHDTRNPIMLTEGDNSNWGCVIDFVPEPGKRLS